MRTDQPNPTSRSLARWARLAALTLAASLLCQQALAQVQVYRCQVNGHLVFQSSPCVADQPKPAAAAPVRVVEAAPAATVAKKKSLADILRERDGERPQSAPREVQGDGANILRSRMGAV